jgi:fatty-acyl-CoA synthase
MMAMSGVEYLDAFFACGKLGAMFVPFNWRSHWHELVELISQTTPHVLLYSDEFKASVAEIEKAIRNTQYRIPCYVYIEGDGIPGSLHYRVIPQPTGRHA